MIRLAYKHNVYLTDHKEPSILARLFPSAVFYLKLGAIVYLSSARAKRGRYDYPVWSDSSMVVLRALESVGVSHEISGIENVERLDTPCVFIANHMSMLETLILPVSLLHSKRITFVIKRSLLDYPVFRYIMRSRDPIAVSRNNPREDLKAVLEGGVERLKKGISIVLFPQKTRSKEFEPAQFSTIGTKLAQRAGVPIVPVALLTDAWGNGKLLKDFGKIDPGKKVRISFGKPITIEDGATDAHRHVLEYIGRKLDSWADNDK